MKNLTAIILAAGYGSRIADVTDNPKSLLPINGKSLLDWHFKSLEKVGINHVVVVTGYKRDVLESYLTQFNHKFKIDIAINEDYRIKGNTYSLYYGLAKTPGAFLLFDADLIYDWNILSAFVSDQSSENQILVGEGSIDDIESAKTMIDSQGFARMTIDKRAVTAEEKALYKYSGEAIGIIKFSKQYRDDLYFACSDFLKDPNNVSKNWEHVMNQFLKTHNMTVHHTENEQWVEIDNKEDYLRAQEIFA